MGPRTLALAPLEVAVGRRRDALARAGRLAVHADAHRAARLAPLEACVDEHAVEPLGLGRALDQPRARHDPRGHHHTAALRDARGGAQIVQATVGARADEDTIHYDIAEQGARAQPHVG